MSTPWGVEFNKKVGMVIKNLREIVLGESEDTVFFSIGCGKY
jgi:hypothetical protein